MPGSYVVTSCSGDSPPPSPVSSPIAMTSSRSVSPTSPGIYGDSRLSAFSLVSARDFHLKEYAVARGKIYLKNKHKITKYFLNKKPVN